jgi:protein TonB
VAASADRILVPGPPPRDVWLTFGLSVLFHGLLTVAIVLVPRFQVGTYITVPVSYTVNLVDAPPGGPAGGGPSPAPSQAPVQAIPAPRPVPAPAIRPAPAARPAPRPTEELTLPGRQSRRKPVPEREPALRPPSVSGQRTAQPVSPMPLAPVAPSPVAPTAQAPPVASAGVGVGKGSGSEVTRTGSGTGSGTGGGSAISYYLTLVDRKIDDNWIRVPLAGAPDWVVEVRFRVLPSGQVRDIELEKSSGNASVDTSALRAIRQSIPLPPFPNLLTEPFLELRYRFVMEHG